MALIEATFELRKSVAHKFFATYALLMSSPVRLALLLPGLLLAGCAAPATYPSLLPRPAETALTNEPAASNPEVAPADPALDAKIAATLQTLNERIAAFDAAAEKAERTIAAARGAAAGSAGWLDAQVALAELDALRSATMEIITQFDDLSGERALALAPDYPSLDAATTRAREAGAAQAARIATLQASLAPA